MVPMVMLYLKLDLKQFSLAYVSSLFVLFMVLSGGGLGIFLIMISLFFMPAVVTMGQLYKKGASAQSVLTAAIVVTIAEVLLLLFMGYGAGMDPIGSFKNMLSNNLMQMPVKFRDMVPTGYADKVTWMLPFFILSFAAFYVFVTHGIVRKLMKKTEAPLPSLPPMHEWRMPKSMVWYFFIVLAIGLIITDKSDLYFQMVVINLLPLFVVIFVAQAIGLLYAFVQYKKWSRVIPILVMVLCLLPPVLYLVCFLGILDIVMPLRQRFFTKL
jgi:uncharacterized protein YybS (DUF2232 family)